jgi:hypothetical protein
MTDEPELQSHPISYELDDLVALSKLVPRGPAQVVRIAAGALIILLAFTMVGEVWALTGLIDWSATIVCLIIGGGVLAFSNRRLRAWFWLRIMRRSPLYAPHGYAITPAALRITSSKGVTDVRWSAFPDVKRSGERLFAFMSPRQAFIIPRRAFDTPDLFEAFSDAAVKRWEHSHRL